MPRAAPRQPAGALAALCREVGGCAAAAPAAGAARGLGRQPAFARHVALYLAHVACGLGLRQVARLDGLHPASVAYAVRRIEAARESSAFDTLMERAEAQVRHMCKGAGDQWSAGQW
ncbi:hypothetical protein [Aquabacter cavernae]|uniref:hypothetical protein n=1 Tax=Aquabacter cavernae TaxID=2496029 RepID=UPI000F8D4E9C|nr:hypothetical protein [Aquabacter cavernae]